MSNEIEEKNNKNEALDAEGKSKQKDDGEKKERDYEKEIKDNVVIYSMPKNVDKVKKGKRVESGFASMEQINSGKSNTDTKAKMIGLVIIFSGMFVLLGGTYLGYIYLIKPYSDNTEESVTKKTTENKNQKKDENNNDEQRKTNNDVAKDNSQKDENKKIEDEKKVAKDDDLELVVDKATTTITTTTEEIATSTEELATSTKDTELVNVVDDYKNDLDNDGLFAVEEVLLGSNSNSIDSDGDGYEDKTEVLALYDPMSTGKITDNKNIGTYTNKDYKYNVFYPKKWKITALDENKTIMFLAPNKAYISIIVQKNLEKKSVEDWYREQFSNKDLGVLESIKNDNWHGVKNAEGTIFYLASADMENIYTLSFIKNSNSANINYTNILRMMVNSFKFIKE